MLIRIGFELIFDLPAAAPMVLLLSTPPARDFTVRRLGGLHVAPLAPPFPPSPSHSPSPVGNHGPGHASPSRVRPDARSGLVGFAREKAGVLFR